MKYLIRHSYLILPLVISLACQKDLGNNNNPDKPHSLRVFLTDHQTPVFDSVFIDIRQLLVKLEDDTLSNGGWINLAIRPGIYNILRFRNGIDTLFATGNLPNTRLRKLKLVLGTQNSAMKNGLSYFLKVKDEDREVNADLDQSNFELNASGQVQFWLDFDAGNSIQVDNSGSGNNNGYLLRSSIKIFGRHNTGEIEGKALPAEADIIIKAVNGRDTVTAIPEHSDGKFKICGLSAGSYQLIFDGTNGFRDTTVNNVIVRSGENTKLTSITLRR